LQRPGNILARRIVAAHHIDGDSCHDCRLEKVPGRPALRPAMDPPAMGQPQMGQPFFRHRLCLQRL
jgi:hypothetical protein